MSAETYPQFDEKEKTDDDGKFTIRYERKKEAFQKKTLREGREHTRTLR